MVADRSTLASYAASFTVFGGSLSVNEWVAVAGLFIAFLTFVTNIYFKARHLRIAQEAMLCGPQNDQGKANDHSEP